MCPTSCFSACRNFVDLLYVSGLKRKRKRQWLCGGVYFSAKPSRQAQRPKAAMELFPPAKSPPPTPSGIPYSQSCLPSSTPPRAPPAPGMWWRPGLWSKLTLPRPRKPPKARVAAHRGSATCASLERPSEDATAPHTGIHLTRSPPSPSGRITEGNNHRGCPERQSTQHSRSSAC